MKPELYLFGLAGEYSLAAIAEGLTRRDWTCHVIDIAVESAMAELETKRVRQAGPCVILASQHRPAASGEYRFHLESKAYIPTLSELHFLLKPVRTYIFPHDLSEPVGYQEITSYAEADAFLAPDSSYWWLRRWTTVIEAGWPKVLAQDENRSSTQERIAFLPSDVLTHRLFGWDRFDRAFAGLKGSGFAFKVPYFPGIEPLEARLSGLGGRQIDARTPSSNVIATHDIIVSNGLSSINTEAAMMGKDTLCVMDGIHPPAAQKALFRKFPNVTLVAPENLAAALADPTRGKSWPPLLSPSTSIS